ncbi:IS3 family transposase [Peribacillus loiseleuriae]
MESINKRNYNDDFKKMVVELYHTGSSVSTLSSEYGVSEVTIYKWIKALTPVNGEENSLTPQDITEIQKENLRMKQEIEILKKGYGHIRQKVTDTELTNLIHDQKEVFPIQFMCEVLDMPRSTYYQSLIKTESARDRENRLLLEQIQLIHIKSKGRYGAPKIHFLLLKAGFSVSLKRVQRIMRKAGIYSITIKKFRPQTNRKPIEARENVLQQDFSTSKLNEKWVADITYIHTLRDGWCYLATVLDLYSKKIIGYSFSRSMTTELVLHALNNAVSIQQPTPGLILHTDLGSQYTSEGFSQALKEQKIIPSFSRKGCPYDHACIESFHSILKKEEVHHVTYLNFESANAALFQFIEGWYNRRRIHGQLNFHTPQEVENQFHQSA